MTDRYESQALEIARRVSNKVVDLVEAAKQSVVGEMMRDGNHSAAYPPTNAVSTPAEQPKGKAGVLDPILLSLVDRLPETMGIGGKLLPLRATVAEAIKRGYITIDPMLIPYLLQVYATASTADPEPVPAPPSGGVGGTTGGGSESDLIWPASIAIDSIELSKPEDGTPIEFTTRRSGDHIFLLPQGTDSFDDGIHIHPHFSYLDQDGVGIKFDGEDETPQNRHLQRSLNIQVTGGSKTGRFVGHGPDKDVTVKGGGIIADGRQVTKVANETLMMDPVIKMVPDELGGVGGGQEVTISAWIDSDADGAAPDVLMGPTIHFTLR